MRVLLSIALLLTACRPQPPAASPTPPPETLDARLARTNFTFAEWRTALGREPLAPDLDTLLDALASAKQAAPQKTFALMDDAELRRAALRTPEVRAKAMQVLGLNVPDGVPVPEVSQLLHTKPGDNCPVCKMRAKAENAGNGL